MTTTVELGTWNGIRATWGHNEDYDEEGLTISYPDGDHDFYTPDDLARFVCRVGSLGCWYLIYSGTAWQTIPALCGEFGDVYERWGCG